MSKALFLPTELPWERLKGKDLEELLYWLLDSMGAKDLEWRIGGTGQGTADGGRDLELSFYVSSPDGDLIKQRWWVEAKGREATVEASEVKAAVNNAAGKSDVDVILIATNTAFSNPTRDWVKEWNSSRIRPRAKLWERTELENHCSKNPYAVVRLFAKALSPQGRLAVVSTKLWDYSIFSDADTLAFLWKHRSELEIDAGALVALVVSEIANGDVERRSWAMSVDENDILWALSHGLVNFPYLSYRANDGGTKHAHVVRGLAYLIGVANQRMGTDVTANMIGKVWELVDGRSYPDEIREMITRPVLQTLLSEVRDVCTSDCSRVITTRTVLSESQVKTYMRRLTLVDDEHVEPMSNEVLVIESFKSPCKIGLALDETNKCPVCFHEISENSLPQTLQTIRLVTNARRAMLP